MFRRALPVGLLIVALAAGACASPMPAAVDPARAIHLQNRLSQALAIDIASRVGGAPSYTTALRPCGGSVILVPGLSGVPTSDMLITLLLDPTGILDGQLAMYTGDPNGMDGSFDGLTILWTTGEIQTPALPRWITVTPEVVVVEDSPPTVDSTCGPWRQPG